MQPQPQPQPHIAPFATVKHNVLYHLSTHVAQLLLVYSFNQYIFFDHHAVCRFAVQRVEHLPHDHTGIVFSHLCYNAEVQRNRTHARCIQMVRSDAGGNWVPTRRQEPSSGMPAVITQTVHAVDGDSIPRLQLRGHFPLRVLSVHGGQEHRLWLVQKSRNSGNVNQSRCA
jgi:hypothetical protein